MILKNGQAQPQVSIILQAVILCYRVKNYATFFLLTSFYFTAHSALILYYIC